jgi:hypothetical protein
MDNTEVADIIAHKTQKTTKPNTQHVYFIDEQQGPYQFNVLLHKDKTRHIG